MLPYVFQGRSVDDKELSQIKSPSQHGALCSIDVIVLLGTSLRKQAQRDLLMCPKMQCQN